MRSTLITKGRMCVLATAVFGMLATAQIAQSQISDCAPTSNKKACLQNTCTNPDQRCQPKCVKVNPATGAFEILECDCGSPERCHVKFATHLPDNPTTCVQPDNGAGTVDLPVTGCDYETPDDDMRIIDGLPPNTTIEAESRLTNIQCGGSQVCSYVGPCDADGGSLGGKKHCATAALPMNLQGTGQLAGYQRSVGVPVAFEVHTAPRTPGDPVQTFDTDMFRLFGQITGDPDFDLLRVVGGTDFGLPSPGHTTLTQLPGGNWAVDSFFDITYRIDFVGAPGGPLGGMSGSTTGTIRFYAGVPIPYCSGICPPGQICFQTRVQNPDGSIQFCCDCRPDGPQECRPKSDLSACEPVVCPVADERCAPRCMRYNPFTGQTLVMDCDCRGLEECHAALPPGGPSTQVCILPDNGTGTADLPPDGCGYETPDGDMHIIDGLPPGTTVQIDSFLHEFFNVSRSPGGSLGGEVEQYNAMLDMPMTGTGSLTGYSRSVVMTTQCQAHAGPRTPGDAVQSFDTDMFMMQGQLPPGDPDFDLLRVTAGTGFGLPSPGHTTLTQLSGGHWAVDSFFDITYRIDFVGAPGGPLGGMSGSTTGTIRFYAGKPVPNCVGVCPPGQNCIKTKTQNADGSIDICCDCESDEPQECRPNADGSACEPVACPDTSKLCVPVAWGVGPTGQSIITACDCREPNECQLNYLVGVPPHCTGVCPNPSVSCQEKPNAVGGFDCDCGCLTPQDCDDGDPCTIDECINGTCVNTAIVCHDGDPCTTDACDPATGACVYTPINCDDGNLCTVDECFNGACLHTPVDCDDDDECTEDFCDPDTGNCVHLPIPDCGDCRPRPDLSGCEPVTCPVADERCAPRCVRHNPFTGQTQVVDCDCRGLDDCRVVQPNVSGSQSCIAPDNGAGTVDLPVPACDSETPDDDMRIVDGLPPGTTIEAEASLTNFTPSCGGGQSVCSFNNPTCREAGGSLGGEKSCSAAQLPMQLQGTGSLNGFSRPAMLPVSLEMHTAPRTPGDPVQTFDTDMFRMFGQITGDPDFDLLRIVAGTDFGLPSPGHTTLTQLPGGNWAVDSFFDITYRIDFVGKPGGPLGGMSGSTTGTIRFYAGKPVPDCEGICPPGEICIKTKTQNADGSIDICCDCEPDQPQECRPNADGSACEPVACPDTTKACVPVAWGVGADGTPIITACDCRGPNECQLGQVAGIPPHCTGACPDPTQPCREIPNAAGGFRCDCQCQTAADCDDGDPCTIDECIGGICVYTTIVCDDGDPCTTDLCDPATGGCVYTPVDCDDNNACTDDRCDPATGACLHTPTVCDDGDPCTTDTCDPATGCVFTPVICVPTNPCMIASCDPGTGQCVQTPKNCDDGDPCTNDSCDPATGACVHSPIPGCGEVPKWSQLPSPDREDIASNVWIGSHGPMTPNVVVADDFRSDGRPITSVRWWGSYLNPEYVPPQFGGFGQPPYQIDGWLISFHQPLKIGGSPAGPFHNVLGLYFAPAHAVQIVPTGVLPCDGHPVFEYRVRLSDCCLIQSNPDPRVPAADPAKCPAHPNAFRERYCWWYALDIQAVVGIRWEKPAGSDCCDAVLTENIGLGDFWGWHATANERGKRPALRSVVGLEPPSPSPCPPMNICPPERGWSYGPWNPVQPVCPFPHRIDMAFELLTNTTVVPPPCPIFHLGTAVSIKHHTLIAPPPAGTTFGIDLPLGPPEDPGVECRTGGPDLIRLVFSEPIRAEDGSLDPGDEVSATGATVSSLAIDGNDLIVELSSICNPCCVTMTVKNGLEGITTLGSEELDGDNDVQVRVLVGDVSGDGTTNVLDLVRVRNNLNQAASSSNFRSDVNHDGTVNVLDLVTVRNNLNQSVACP